MASITAVILTYNEELNIFDCLTSIKSVAERIIVMDNFSNDNTSAIAKKFGAEVYQSNKSYKERLNEVINREDITSDWILNIDADERITPKAEKEIILLCTKYKESNINGIVMRYMPVFMGKELKHCANMSRKLRLFKKNTAYMENVELDEHIVLKYGKSICMKNPIIHYDFKGLDHFIKKINGYSIRHAKEYYEIKNGNTIIPYEGLAKFSKKRRIIKFKYYYKLPIRIRSFLYFIYYYYFNLVFLDGLPGKMYAFFQIYWYKFLTDSYIYENEVKNKK